MKIAALGREGFHVKITMTTEENATKLFDALCVLANELDWFSKYDEPTVPYRMATASIADNLAIHYAQCNLQHVPGTICKGCGWSEKERVAEPHEYCEDCGQPLDQKEHRYECWSCGFKYKLSFDDDMGFNYPDIYCPNCRANREDE